MEAVIQRAKRIKLVVFDVDGVMTDGTLFVGDDGQEYKGFNSHDGHGMKMLRMSGVVSAIITGRTSRVVEIRAKNLGIAHIHQGAGDKLAVYNALLSELDVSAEESAFMGDDVVDLPCMRRAGLALSVPAAPPVVKQYAHYVTELGGGRGAVREICELLMRAQGTYDQQMAPFLA